MEPILKLPKSNSECLNFCTSAVANGRDDQSLGRHLKIGSWIDTLDDLKEPTRGGMVVLQNTYSTRREVTALRNKCVVKMEHSVRDFRSGLTRRVIRDEEPEYVLSFYQMPNNDLSGSKTAGEWYQATEWIIKGEEKAVEKGFPAMTNPSIEDLRSCMAMFEENRIAADVADRNYREAQANMTDLRRKVVLAARGLAVTLRILFDGEEGSTVRRAMRGYGFRFTINGGEEPAEPSEPNPDGFPEPVEEAASTQEVPVNSVSNP